jgi:nucleoside 2-deoxyribosyltransferase
MLKPKFQGKVYIAGPVLGLENNQNYRPKLKQILASKGFWAIDPLERQKQ